MEATIAVSILDSVSRTVQSKGWDFNTDLDVTLTQQDDGTITLGSSVLHVEFDITTHSARQKPVLLNKRVYDRIGRTFVWTGTTLKAYRLVRLEAWDDLPETCQQYLTKHAAREFSIRMLGAEMMARAASYEELEAKKLFTTAHGDNSRPNMLSGPTGRHILARGLLRD